MWKRILLGCGVPLVLFVILAVVAGKALLKAQPKVQRSETVQRGDVEIKVVETGAIEPLHKVEVKSKVGGKVLQLYVDEGSVVRQGQLLATTDPIDVNNDVAALKSQLGAARARLASAMKNTTYQADTTGTNIAQFQHAVDAARTRLQQAEVQADAQPKLTGESIGIAQSNLDAARANLSAQQQMLDLLVQSTNPQALVSAQANYDQAVAQRTNAARNLKRQQQLLARGFVSQQAVDQAESDAAVAEAHVADTKKHLDLVRQANSLQEANARAQVASAQAQVRQMQAALDQARTDTSPITKRQEVENAKAALAQAEAQLAAAKAGRTQDKMRQDEAAAAAADAQQIQHLLNEKLVNLHDTNLYASMSGVVTKRYVERGELITPGISSFSSGTPVMQISDLAVMLVKININEVDIAKVRVGLPVEVTIDAARGVVFTGHVRKVAPEAANAGASSSSSDSSSSGSSSSTQGVIRFPVEVQIDRPDSRLRPGMSARCSIIVARRKGVLRLPIDCVSGQDGQGSVNVVTTTVKDNKPTETTAARTVDVGLRGDEFVEIKSGLREGEKVRPLPYTGPPRKTIEMRND